MKGFLFLFVLLSLALFACVSSAGSGSTPMPAAPTAAETPSVESQPAETAAPQPSETATPPTVPSETAPAIPTAAPVAFSDYAIFSINAQDFSYPEQSAAVLDKIITLHETYNVPVDVYLTDVMARIYAEQFPQLLERLKTSPVVAVTARSRFRNSSSSSARWSRRCAKSMAAHRLRCASAK